MIDILASTPLFSGLNEEQLSQIRGIAQDKQFGRGQAIFWEGDPGNGFYLVVSGKVKVYKTSLEGKEQILHIYGPGHPIGEVPVFSGSRFPANAMAIEKSRMLFFPRKDFVDLISGQPSLALNMLAVLSMRLRQFTVQVENLSLKEVPARLASYLVYLASEQGSPDIVTLPISKGQLASLLGTIPETLSRIFNKMTQQGLIKVKGSEITIVNKDEIEALSENG
ncbi:MAG: Crp/Fnr family transcriptional regulator [Desulfobacteraceae bacterium]|jgi:CRP/FNR family transcriptional regulator